MREDGFVLGLADRLKQGQPSGGIVGSDPATDSEAAEGE
jgi:hypothetical protein